MESELFPFLSSIHSSFQIKYFFNQSRQEQERRAQENFASNGTIFRKTWTQHLEDSEMTKTLQMSFALFLLWDVRSHEAGLKLNMILKTREGFGVTPIIVVSGLSLLWECPRAGAIEENYKTKICFFAVTVLLRTNKYRDFSKIKEKHFVKSVWK